MMSATSISKESLKAIMQSKETVVSKGAAMADTEKVVVAEVEKTEVTKTEVAKKSSTLLSAKPSKRKAQIYSVLNVVLPPMFGILLLLAVWTLISHQSPNLPGPLKTWYSAIELFSDPFYVNGPNDQGVGWNILASLQRVALGFGLAALVGIQLVAPCFTVSLVANWLACFQSSQSSGDLGDFYLSDLAYDYQHLRRR
jgi:nitrate/nitrite transport system permease protein